jgi:hypothetical protein
MTKIKINSRKYTKGKSCRSRQLHARIVGQRSGNPLETFKREVCKKQKREPEDKRWSCRNLESERWFKDETNSANIQLDYFPILCKT